MAESEPPLIAFNRWLVGALFIPLLPLLGIVVLRKINGDALHASMLWCSEVPTFALQLVAVMIAKSEELIRKKTTSPEAKATAYLFRNASYCLAFVLMFCFYSMCRDGTLTDKLKDDHRTRIMWITTALAVILTGKTWMFSRWHRKLGRSA